MNSSARVCVCVRARGERDVISRSATPALGPVTNRKCLALVYCSDQVKRKILEVWAKRQFRLPQINGLIISY